MASAGVFLERMLAITGRTHFTYVMAACIQEAANSLRQEELLRSDLIKVLEDELECSSTQVATLHQQLQEARALVKETRSKAHAERIATGMPQV